MNAPALFTALTVTALLLAGASPASALPTMIRLGYADCAACHVSPQGGGLLNEYGRGIDEAQSLRAGEYHPSENPLVTALGAHGRVMQDLRAVFADQQTWTAGRSAAGVFRPKLMYRNVTMLGRGVRLAGVITTERSSAPRPALGYDPPSTSSTAVVNTALVHYRLNGTVEVAGGKDQLPTGLNIPDLSAAIKARNRYGYYDAPLQVKAFVGNKRYLLVPYGYAPGGTEPAGEAESGGGVLAELDLFGTGKTVTGVSILGGSARNGGRRLVGSYARLGFGHWGVLAEHDVTSRTRVAPLTGSFDQQASYVQLFWAAREWLVASGVAERLRVEQPFEERFVAGKLELAARLSNQMAITVATRLQRNQITDTTGTSVAVQLALKTPQ